MFFLIFLLLSFLSIFCSDFGNLSKEESRQIVDFFFENDYLEEKKTWPEIVKDSSFSVAQLINFSAVFDWKEPYKTPNQNLSHSSCFFIDKDGYMITNAHCVHENRAMYIQFSSLGKERFDIELVSICYDRDLALIKLKKHSKEKLINLIGEIPYLKFGDSTNIHRADEIMALGYPLGQEWLKSTLGSVSGIQQLDKRFFIQVDTPINPGNSGGCALNSKGNIVGVNTCVINRDGVQNIGYIVPSREVITFLLESDYFKEDKENLKNNFIKLPNFGIYYHSTYYALKEYIGDYKTDGIYICNVISKSLAEDVGICIGDIIYKINDIEIDQYGDLEVSWASEKISLLGYLSQMKNGEFVKIELFRGGENFTYKFQWKIKDKMPVRFVYSDYENVPYTCIAGLVIMPLTLNHVNLFSKYNAEFFSYFKMENQMQPKLIISHIFPGSIAEKVRFVYDGMIIKKVNEVYVKTIEDLNNALMISLETGYISFEMTNNELFVVKLKEALKQENYLSKMYYYKISEVVKNLINEIEKN